MLLRTRRQAQITSAASNLRNYHLALELYRSNWDAKEVYLSYMSYHDLGLPPYEGYLDRFFASLGPELANLERWMSPCGADQTIFDTALPILNIRGMVSVSYGFYSPWVMSEGSGNLADYEFYIPEYRENIVVYADPYCNPPNTLMSNPLTSKRALAITLSGQLVNQIKKGNAANLRFYSDRPD
ncbi:MAG: hypothetical protein HND42_12120 [Armatimonadetes bacterium]|nr:hypothetical protein [Armatimonadota bacterium]